MLILFLAGGSPSAANANPTPVRMHVEVEGMRDRQASAVTAAGGAVRLGRFYSIEIDAAHGRWSGDSTRCRMALPADSLRVRVGEAYLAWTDGEYEIEQPVILSAPGVLLVVRRGAILIDGTTLRLSVSESPGFGDPQVGWFTSLSLVAGIVLLFWSGSRYRRTLHTPRISLRARSAGPGGS